MLVRLQCFPVDLLNSIKLAGIKMGRESLLRVDRCEYYSQINIVKCLYKDSHALQAGQISGLAYLTFFSWTLLSLCSLQPVHDLYRTQGFAPCVAFEGPS